MVPPMEAPLSMFYAPEAGVPPSELTAAIAEEGEGRSTIAVGYNCLLIETAAGTALVDTGLGPDFVGYGEWFTPLVGRLQTGLAEVGIRPEQIGLVVLTHLHQDHVRGAIAGGNLTFPAAQYVVNRTEVRFWGGTPDCRIDADAVTARSAIELFAERVVSVNYDAEILPGIRTVSAAGHTPGHMALLLESHGERLLCLADTFYDRIQLARPHWSTPYDLDPARSVESRRQLLTTAADEETRVHAYHMPFPGLGRIVRNGEAFGWEASSAG